MDNNTSPSDTYKSLEEIKLRKAMLLRDIQKEDNRIQNIWVTLFRKPEAFKKNTSPSRRINSLMSTGAGFFDTVILGWKLYRKFRR
ncbi:hypothetical protein HMPREF0645_1854 [Hallella bergensis DSM 17361]|uniref:Uncharacterized protein n=1 Tax=Hallella bergensis DSM 17361 TaxID=585502 RepID=D1PY19_9BACT|nr:hypothetical protein [Hallella bergensis]EFA43692.1 hypothetical protein HMPREF0645_1854 [Hallella bergensis DSM 17361]